MTGIPEGFAQNSHRGIPRVVILGEASIDVPGGTDRRELEERNHT